MSWRRTQRNNKRLNRGVIAPDSELRKRKRVPIAPPTRIHPDKRDEIIEEFYLSDFEDEWIDEL